MTTVKSASITGLDALTAPYIVAPATAGEGARARLNHINDYVTVPAAAGTGTIFRFIRVPSTIKLKSVIFESEAMGAGKFQIGLYYSDSAFDGTTVANQGLLVSGCVALFASDVDCSSAVARAGYTNANANAYPVAMRNSPLWKAAGLATDPGGYFDICTTVHTTAVTTGAANQSIEAEFAE